MKAYLPQIAEPGFGWNEQPLTEADFFRLCKKHKINVSFLPLNVRGYYSTSKGKHYIAIKEGMNSFQTLLVMFHELGHYFMHTPGGLGDAKFSGKTKNSREEKEADAFAYCALLPLLMLKRLDPQELVEIEGFPARFLMRRLEIYERYGI